jgi:hypothetical protein
MHTRFEMRKIVLLFMAAAGLVSAHCDSLDGPVAQAARRAFTAGDVALVLPWVKPSDEAAIRDAFVQTQQVRKLDPQAAKLAETWFLETLVRIHRAGEGAPYSGLKPAGFKADPALTAADRSLELGEITALEQSLLADLKKGLRDRYGRVRELSKYSPSDVAAGRKYVAAYVDYIHFAESLSSVLGAARVDHEAEHQH